MNKCEYCEKMQKLALRDVWLYHISEMIKLLERVEKEVIGEDKKLHKMFWNSDIVNVEVKIRNELRKEIRERLKQI